MFLARCGYLSFSRLWWLKDKIVRWVDVEGRTFDLRVQLKSRCDKWNTSTKSCSSFSASPCRISGQGCYQDEKALRRTESFYQTHPSHYTKKLYSAISIGTRCIVLIHRAVVMVTQDQYFYSQTSVPSSYCTLQYHQIFQSEVFLAPSQCRSFNTNNNSNSNAHAYELESELNGLRTSPPLYW